MSRVLYYIHKQPYVNNENQGDKLFSQPHYNSKYKSGPWFYNGWSYGHKEDC